MDERTVDVDWPGLVVEQLTWHWDALVRPHLEGLTDEELHWEPVPGCWGVRPRGDATSSHAAGGGDWVIDFAFPEPAPPPVTTIAWRLWHVIEGVLGGRARAHFEDGPGVDYGTVEYRPDAAGTLAALDDVYARWVTGVRALGPAGMARACGAHEGPFADHPMAALVLHINREAIHHLAEVLLLRDLYRAEKAEPSTTAGPAPIDFQVTFDTADPHAQARFWAAALRYEVEEHDGMIRGLLDQGVVGADDVVEVDGVLHWRTAVAIRPPGTTDPSATGRVLFVAVPEPRTVKNRVHLDLRVAGVERTPEAAARLDAEVDRLEGLGATVLYRHDAPDGRWVTMADPEGNELCLT